MGGSERIVGEAHRFGPAAPREEYVYGSCSPGWHSAGDRETVLEEWIQFVQSQGIERVCCLLAGRQLDEQDATVGRYREAFGDEQVCHAPIPDYQLASREKLAGTILPFLEESVSRDERVVVHCLSGVGRTGQVLSAWLVAAHGYSPQRAVESVKEMGRDPTEAVDHGNATEEELFDLLGSMPSLDVDST